MIWAAIFESWKSPLIFVKEGAKINANSYIDDILTPAQAQMQKHFNDLPFTFQQYGAPSHPANKTQDWCERHFPSFWEKELWPLLSPDLKTLDFCVRSILEQVACATAHDNAEALKKFLEREWTKIPQGTFRAAVKSFRSRRETVIAAKVGHI